MTRIFVCSVVVAAALLLLATDLIVERNKVPSTSDAKGTEYRNTITYQSVSTNRQFEAVLFRGFRASAQSSFRKTQISRSTYTSRQPSKLVLFERQGQLFPHLGTPEPLATDFAEISSSNKGPCERSEHKSKCGHKRAHAPHKMPLGKGKIHENRKNMFRGANRLNDAMRRGQRNKRH